MSRSTTPHRRILFPPHLHAARPYELALRLATALALPPERARLAVRSAWYPHEPPQVVPFLDVDAWLATMLGCIPAFSMTIPSLRAIRTQAIRSMLVVAMARSGNNLSEASNAIDTHRKIIRDNLRRAGLYPLPDIAGDLLTTKVVSPATSTVTVYARATLTGLGVLLPEVDADDRSVLRAAVRVLKQLGCHIDS